MLICLLVLACVLPASAQTEAGANKSLLWRISGKHMNKPSYLFGTIHLICKDDYVWTDKMIRSFDSASEVCFELDMDEPSVMVQITEGMINSSGEKLSSYFTAAQYQKLSAYLKDSLNMDISMFEQMKPIALETFVSMKGSATCANPTSYEEELMQQAKAKHKNIVGLEEPSEQIALLDKIPTDSIVKELMDDLNGANSKNDDVEYHKLVDAYKIQDLPALYALIKKSGMTDLGAFLDERNKKWIDRMADKMEQQSVFFAVGAGHLWGTNGIINLLRKDGYTVTPVK